MKVEYAPYTLKKQNGQPREGALLKFFFNPELVGYADCHPWPELGDNSLQQQLKLLAKGKETILTERALDLALMDAEARSLGIPLVPKCCVNSHFLILDLLSLTSQNVQRLIRQGYTHVKIKMGNHLSQEIAQLLRLFTNTPLQLRLDFNEKLEKNTVHRLLKQIQVLKPQIDFLEDPCPYPIGWKELQEEGWNLACDRKAQEAFSDTSHAKILILKPALHSLKIGECRSQQRCVVTSYVGHPLEQVAAAYAASLLDPQGQEVHGLLSHHVYDSNPFSTQLNWNSPQFVFPSGNGFGFTQELEALQWSILR